MFERDCEGFINQNRPLTYLATKMSQCDTLSNDCVTLVIDLQFLFYTFIDFVFDVCT